MTETQLSVASTVRSSAEQRDIAKSLQPGVYSYNESVRRLLAILLLSSIHFLWIAPAFSATSDAQLPACCRSTGKHKCALTPALARLAAGPQVSGMSAKCPCTRPSSTASVYSQSSLLNPGRMAAYCAAQPILLPASAGVVVRACFSRSSQKRGPPSSIA
jgi:hypothetical protein